ncbi:hypothetical protein Patl1_03526 [Pistacia atlantica]|uniref:Uncharacterized protein n=1 Tax=Pistacia atlantica TaxID=434234 RepID=A0ACC1CCY3_9ROSI|nr:hypothetical protein Patl1_03526 [Pistacia atlantica]
MSSIYQNRYPPYDMLGYWGKSPGFAVQAGIALGELQSLGDLYDFKSMATLFFIGVVSITPTLVSKSQS